LAANLETKTSGKTQNAWRIASNVLPTKANLVHRMGGTALCANKKMKQSFTFSANVQFLELFGLVTPGACI
jgi:hypothetical protein